MTLGDGTVEVDVTKTNINRTSKKTNKHCGRFLVIYHRESGQYALEPLEDKDVLKGAPPPPETYEEVKGPILKKVHSGHVLSSDSGGAFKKVAKLHLKGKGVVHATVVHKNKTFSRVVHMPVKALSKRVRDRVAELPTTTSRTYRFKAGDQLAESAFQAIKRNIMRLNLARSTQNASLNFLSSAFLHKHVGLEAVAKGLATYQAAILDSCSPVEAYKSAKWLTSQEDAA